MSISPRPRSADARDVDLAIVGFGFSGLNVLGHLVRHDPRLRVAVIADDHSGRGLAYATRDPSHLLNVVANRMGAWADEPEDFARWLTTGDAEEYARRLGVVAPGERSFAPRALYGAYLSTIRRSLLHGGGDQVRLLRGRVRSLRRSQGRWELGGDVSVRARRCVLATGHDRRPVFGELRHPRLYEGPWSLPEWWDGEGPVILIGSGLTAVDAVLSLRRIGYDGRIVALSRNGRLPAAHTARAPRFELSEADADRLTSVAAIVDFIRRGHPDGQWRPALDALRPHTARLWQRLDPEQQRAAVDRFSGLWNVRRHRMAPTVADRIARELEQETLVVRAVSDLQATVVDGRLRLEVTERGTPPARTITPAAVIDCTGPLLRCARSPQPLLRGLAESGVARVHPTGLGLVADEDRRVGEDLYALGPLLVGQRWESIAVPELREDAAAIAQAVTGRTMARSR